MRRKFDKFSLHTGMLISVAGSQFALIPDAGGPGIPSGPNERGSLMYWKEQKGAGTIESSRCSFGCSPSFVRLVTKPSWCLSSFHSR